MCPRPTSCSSPRPKLTRCGPVSSIYPELAEDVAIEARLALALTDDIKELDERSAVMLDRADPAGIIHASARSAELTGAAILVGWATRLASGRWRQRGP